MAGSKIITVSVDLNVEKKFRKLAKALHGKKKGYLGRALTEAMDRWTRDKEQSDSVAAALQLLDEGLDLGGLKYKHRDELHEC
jgi:predicted transcriptional regulator